MSQNKPVNINRTVFDKDAFNQTVDTQFSQLIDRDQSVPFDINTATVADFFALYDRFFYEIPKQGDINSHYYLVETSGEYINFNKYQAEIQELLQEITDLRANNLELRQELSDTIVEFQSQIEQMNEATMQ